MSKSNPIDGPDYTAWEDLNEVPLRIWDQVSRLLARICEASAETLIIGTLAGITIYRGHELGWPLVALCAIIALTGTITRVLLNRQKNAKRTKGAKTAPTQSGDDG